MRQMAFRWPRLSQHGQAVTHGSDFRRLDNDERQQRQGGYGSLRHGASHRGQRAHGPRCADRRGPPRCRRRLADRLDTGWPDGRRTHGAGKQRQAQRRRDRLTQIGGPSVSALISVARRPTADVPLVGHTLRNPPRIGERPVQHWRMRLLLRHLQPSDRRRPAGGRSVQQGWRCDPGPGWRRAAFQPHPPSWSRPANRPRRLPVAEPRRALSNQRSCLSVGARAAALPVLDALKEAR